MNAPTRLRRLRGIAGAFVGSGGALVLGVLTSVLVARWLGPEGKGVFTGVLLLPSFLASGCQLGLGSAAIYLINRKPEHRREIVNNNLLFTAVSSVVTVGVLVLLGAFLQARYYRAIEDPWPIYAAFLTIPALVAWSQVTTVHRALERYGAFNLTAYWLPQTVDLVFVFVAVVPLGMGPRGAVLAFVLAKLVTGAGLLIHLARTVGIGGGLSWPLFRESLAFGLVRMAGGLMERGSRRADQAFLVALVSAADLGIYSVAATLGELPLLMPKALGTVLYPSISSGDRAQAERYLVRSIRHLAVWVLLAVVGLGIAGGLAIRWTVGEDYLAAYPLLLWLLPGVAVKAVSTPFLSFFAGTGRPGLLNWARGIALAVGLGLLFVLLPRCGLVGVAMASTAGYVVHGLVLFGIWWAESGPSAPAALARYTREDLELYRELMRRGRS